MNPSARVGLIDELSCETGFVGAQAFLGAQAWAGLDGLQMGGSLYGVIALSLSCFENLLKPWCREGQEPSWPSKNGSHVDGLLDIFSK